MKPAARVMTLHEYETLSLPATELDRETGLLLWQRYDRDRGALTVEFPSPRTEHCWQLTSRGWVGHIRVTAQLALSLQPRLALPDLFGALQVAHGLQSFDVLTGIVHVDSLPALYDRLAGVLADNVLQLARRGLAGGYVARRERLPFVRGRLLPQPVTAPSVPPAVLCEHETWTSDVPDNQILAWTLHCIEQAGFCAQPVRQRVRRARRALMGQATLQPFSAADCLQRHYDRLNGAYKPLHALCHFFLSHSMPASEQGPAPMSAFLVHMPRLYEQYVAATLRQHLPGGWTLKAQETVTLPGEATDLRFTIDLVLYDRAGEAIAVLDTKYRLPSRAEPASVAQVVAYAQAKSCGRALLLYPRALPQPLDVTAGNTRIQSLPFTIGPHAAHDARLLLQTLA